jgi:hypothetical protein
MTGFNAVRVKQRVVVWAERIDLFSKKGPEFCILKRAPRLAVEAAYILPRIHSDDPFC